MPMRNARPFVVAALRSILVETGVLLEVLVVDDGSTDGSANEVARLADGRVRLLDGPRRGIAACLNVGFVAARGQVVMRCDADDLYSPGRIARQAEWLRANDGYGAVCGGYSMVSQSGNHIARFGALAQTTDEDVDEELRHGILRTHLCTFAWRKELFAEVGMFRDYFESAEDLDFQMRLGEHCKVRFLPSLTYVYRLHNNSITHQQGASRRIFFEETAKRFQEERSTTGTDALARGLPPTPPSNTLDAPTRAEEQAQAILIGRSWVELDAGRRLAAVRLSLLAIGRAPLRRVGWASMIRLLARTLRRRRTS